MAKQKSVIQSFSQYAIIDLPVEICIDRAIEFCSDRSFGDAQRVDDDRLDILYEFDNQPPIDGVVNISRWQGTQTQVTLYATIRDEPYDDLEDFSSQFIKIIGFIAVLVIGAILPTDVHFIGFIFLVVVGLAIAKYLSSLNIQAYRDQPMDTAAYLQTEWDVLLVMLASDENGILSSLIERGEQDHLLYEDNLSKPMSASS